MKTAEHRRRWDTALGQFEDGLTRSGYSGTTVALRVKHLRRFSGVVDGGPWDVVPGDVASWLDSLTGSAATRQPYKTSVRSFYRWAYSSGLIFNDPSESPDLRRQRKPVPACWAEPLRDFRTYLRASGRPETTVGVRLSHLRRFARETLAAGPWTVTLDDLVEWLGGKHLATETRRAYRSTLRSFYGWAHETGRIETNPAMRFPVVKASRPQPRPVDDDVMTLALSRAGERETLMIRLSAELGLRAGEVSRVHSADLLGAPGRWSLVVHGKGARDRVVPVPDSLGATLADRGQGYIFPGNDHGHLSPHYVSKLVSALLPEGVTMHKLRHRFATRAYGVNRDVLTVQQLLGHSSPETTQRYVQVPDNMARALVNAI